jgi:hypothetical protein
MATIVILAIISISIIMGIAFIIIMIPTSRYLFEKFIELIYVENLRMHLQMY